MKKGLLVPLFLAAAWLYGQQGPQPPKYALVIGNGNYTGITKLENPVNDANDMADTLQGLGFTVDKVLDGSLDQMENAVMTLKNRLSVSRDSYGFFFYAGHGVQSNGENYLLPVDSNIPSEAFLRQRAVSVQTMLDELNNAGNYLNVVILDACRDNPFGWRRGGSRGLTIVSSQPADSIIVYATSAGSTAADGSGRNGLFTGFLLNNLKVPGIEVSEVFRRTMGDVASASGNMQRPAIYNQFPGLAYLGTGPLQDASQPSAQVAAAPAPLPDTGQARPGRAPKPARERPQPEEAAHLWTAGLSLGTAFAAPILVGTVRGTIAPFNYSFLEIGMDVGFGSNYENSGYYSLYPYANYAFFMPFSRIAAGSGMRGGLYAGLGAGYMVSRYTFNEDQNEYWYLSGESAPFNIFAVNAVLGVSLIDRIDISYTLRTNFESASNKLSVGYVYRFR